MVSRGGGIFMTTIWNLHSSRLPQSSMATHCTSLVPTGKQVPEGGLQIMVTLVSQSSRASARNSTRSQSKQVLTTMLVGQRISGGVVSRMTRTWKLHSDLCPQSSSAVQ